VAVLIGYANLTILEETAAILRELAPGVILSALIGFPEFTAMLRTLWLTLVGAAVAVAAAGALAWAGSICISCGQA